VCNFNDVVRIHKEFEFNITDKWIEDAQKMHRKSVLAFSDCVVINLPLQSEATKYGGTFDPLLSEIVGFAYAQGACVLNSLFIRGGLELGWWFQNESVIISQSMVGAYKRESTANIPVIALSEELYKYFINHKHRNFYSKDYDPINTLFRNHKIHEDEFWYIDYISICIQALDWHRSTTQIELYRTSSPDEKDEMMAAGYRENVDIWLSAHARNIEQAGNSSPNNKVKQKYQWLSAYHNEIAKKYSHNTQCLCKF